MAQLFCLVGNMKSTYSLFTRSSSYSNSPVCRTILVRIFLHLLQVFSWIISKPFRKHIGYSTPTTVSQHGLPTHHHGPLGLCLLVAITHATPVSHSAGRFLRRDQRMPGHNYFNGAGGLIVDTKYEASGPAKAVAGSFTLPLKAERPDASLSYSNASFAVLYGGDRVGVHDTDPCGASATVGAGVDMHVNSDVDDKLRLCCSLQLQYANE